MCEKKPMFLTELGSWAHFHPIKVSLWDSAANERARD